jgi:Ca2+-binding RTX toxin-like protein
MRRAEITSIGVHRTTTSTTARLRRGIPVVSASAEAVGLGAPAAAKPAEVSLGEAATFAGTRRNDPIIAGAGDDHDPGGRDHDTIDGKEGNHTLGDWGHDRVFAGQHDAIAFHGP